MTTSTSPTTTGNRRLRTTLLIVGSIVLAAVIAGAIISLTVTATRPDTSARYTVIQDFESIDLNTQETDVTLRYADVDETQLSLHQDGGASVSLSRHIDDGVLSVTAKDSDWLPWSWGFSDRSSTLEIVLPETLEATPVSVKVTSNAGDLRLDGEFATVFLDSTAGNVSLAGGAEDLTVHSTAGNVKASDYGLTGPLVGRSTAGDVAYQFRTIPASVDITSSAGRVSFAVPQGSYRIVARSIAGNIVQKVESSDSSDRVFHFDSTAGDILITNQ
jgi:hypothetical protein